MSVSQGGPQLVYGANPPARGVDCESTEPPRAALHHVGSSCLNMSPTWLWEIRFLAIPTIARKHLVKCVDHAQ